MRLLDASRLALALACVATAAPAQAQLFKCVNSAGRTVYQDSPCGDADKQTSIRAPSAPAPAPAAPPKADAKPGAARPPAPAPAPSGPSAVDTVAGYTVCAERVPNFANKYSANYESWKQRNAAAIDRLASEPDASRLDARLHEERERAATQNMAERCVDVATELLPPATAAK